MVPVLEGAYIPPQNIGGIAKNVAGLIKEAYFKTGPLRGNAGLRGKSAGNHGDIPQWENEVKVLKKRHWGVK